MTTLENLRNELTKWIAKYDQLQKEDWANNSVELGKQEDMIVEFTDFLSSEIQRLEPKAEYDEWAIIRANY